MIFRRQFVRLARAGAILGAASLALSIGIVASAFAAYLLLAPTVGEALAAAITGLVFWGIGGGLLVMTIPRRKRTKA